MYCRNCGNTIPPQAVICVRCGVPTSAGSTYCQACGSQTSPGAFACTTCGARLATPTRRSKLVAGLFGVLLGGLGIHRFYLGYTTIGVIQIVTSVVTCYTIGPIWGLVEGILIFTGNLDRDADGNPLAD